MAAQTIDLILAGLMRRYQERVPDVKGILDCLVADGHIVAANEIENDHIAFRTMGVPQLGMQSLEKIFLHHGYEKGILIALSTRSWTRFGIHHHVKTCREYF